MKHPLYIQIGNTRMRHRDLVADIKEDVIVGTDVVNRFRLDLKRDLQVNYEEVILHRWREKAFLVPPEKLYI